MAKVRWSLKTQLQGLDDQAADFLKKGNLTRCRKALEKELTKPGREGLLDLDLPMVDIQREKGALGAIAVLKGDVDGWQHLQTGLAYDNWRSRITVSFQESQDFQIEAVFYNATAVLLAHAIATREDNCAVWFGERMMNGFVHGTGIFSSGNATPFGMFMVKLFALWKGREGELRGKNFGDLGPFQTVFTAWKRTEALSRALEEVCDFHCDHARYRADGNMIFLWEPYRVLPVEILAVRRIRADLGLPTPEVQHPLMQTPLAEVPETIPPVKDALLEKIIAKARSVFPGIDSPPR